MTAQKLILSLTTLTGGAIGLLAPIGFVKCLLRTGPEGPASSPCFFLPVVPRPADRTQGRTARDRRQAGSRRNEENDRPGMNSSENPFSLGAGATLRSGWCRESRMSALSSAVSKIDALQHLIEQLTQFARHDAMRNSLVKE